MTSRFLLDLREDYISKLPDGHWEDSSFHISDMSTIQFNFTLEPYASDESFVLTSLDQLVYEEEGSAVESLRSFHHP